LTLEATEFERGKVAVINEILDTIPEVTRQRIEEMEHGPLTGEDEANTTGAGAFDPMDLDSEGAHA
jgi:hypothetical protein